ncbi:DNA transposase THAP9 [Paramuricea clavata]|nr:DNA transposase THAP9 [Paramuricea clavata]
MKRKAATTDAIPDVPNKKPKRKFQPVGHDHIYCTSPSKVIPKMKKSLENKRKKMKSLSKKSLRRDKTIKGLLKKLRDLKYLSKEQSENLMSNFGHMTKKLFINEHKNNQKSKARATIRSWAAAIDCDPGFLTNVIDELKNSLDEDEKDCAILVDEMSIKKEVLWDRKNKKFAGNTDYGCILAEEQDSIATNALVFMAVGLKKPWFHPIAYFLVDRVNGKMQAQLIKEAINLLTEAALDVQAVVFDGCAKNLTTARCLGCKIDKLDGSFNHPSRPNKTIYVILDVCHMLKLARNSLGDKKVFHTDTGAKICWNYITELYNVQKSDVLHLGNKLKTKHIKWHNQKMNVAIAAQTLSNSVAAGLMYLKNIKVPQFLDSDETAEFILKINNLFDILNSKSKYGKHYKSPIRLENLDELKYYVHETIAYLKELKDSEGVKLIDGPRKTFILGFALSSKSILALAKHLLTRNYNQFEYVLTYRLSQDQLFFSKIRSRLGCNNNPNALQFKWALRALLQKNQVAASPTANCSVVEEGKLAEEATHLDKKVTSILDCSTIWHEDVLSYIGGYIVKMITNCLKCAECAAALVAENNSQPSLPDHTYGQSCSSMPPSLISFKSYGSLINPSTSVLKTVKVADSRLRLLAAKWSNLPKKALETLQRDVLQEVKPSVFQSLQQHSQDTHVLDKDLRDDHITILVKKITDLYSKIFLHQFSKVYSERIVRQEAPSKRQKLNKLILFGND